MLHSVVCLLGGCALFGSSHTCVAGDDHRPPPAYTFAAQRSGIPSNVLFAVALQESGVTLRGQRLPWPWTLNIAGRGHYFKSRAEACTALLTALTHVPASRIDAGLTQINLGHQRHFYGKPCELLWPHRNLEVAATLLRAHHRAGEDWLMAAGRFHRPAGGLLAAKYRRSVARHLNDMAVTSRDRP
ncbi:lytic transglycosylase domain-containing protein [Pseudomonas koreensis]